MSLSNKGYQLNVDLENEIIFDEKDFETNFKIDPFRRESLLKGQDEIARTLTSSSHIDNFENNDSLFFSIQKISPFITNNGTCGFEIYLKLLEASFSRILQLKSWRF